MKTSHILPLLSALALCALAAVPLEWVADVERPAPAQFAVMRGETVSLRAALVRRGAPYDLANAADAAIYWQTNGMGGAWWSADATIASNTIAATFTPAMDPGAPTVTAFLSARDADGAIYRAQATLRFIHAPGAVPNEIDLPARVIDFATVEVANAPWIEEETDPTVPAWAKSPTPPLTEEADPVWAAEKGFYATAAALSAAATASTNYTDAAVAGRVSTGGDTMTGGLTVPNLTVGGRPLGSTIGEGSVAEGSGTTASGSYSHAEGVGTIASGTASHAEGAETIASGTASHAEGEITIASGYASHAAGFNAFATNAAAFVWHGAAEDFSGPPYYSHGDGTFNINPVGGAAGFYIGETNLVGLLPEYIATVETERATVYHGTSRDTSLRDGKLVLLYLRTQPSNNFSLNLTLADGSSTGNIPVRFWGTTAAGTQITAGSIIHIVYRGGAWYWSDRDTNTDTYDRVRINQEIRAYANIGRNSLCGASTNGLGYVKLAPGAVIDPAQPLLYLNKTSTLAAGSRDSNFYRVTNVGTALLSYHGVAGKQRSPLYLLGALSDDGRAFTVCDPAFSYEPEPPCFPLGFFHATTTNSFYFIPGPIILPPSVPATRKIAGVPLFADIPLAGGAIVTNGALRLYDAAPDGTLSNLLWDSSSAADTATVADLARRVTALESGGGAASWANYDAQGADNPDPDVVMLNRAYTAIGSGFHWASSGGHYCLCSSGSVAYLADAGGSLRLFGNSISNYVGIVAGGVVTVGARASGFAVDGGVASITYSWSGGAHPTIYGAATLSGPWSEMTSAVWVDDAEAGTATASFPADGNSFFYKATTTAQLGEHLESTLPAYLPGGVMTRANDLDPVVFDSAITITSGGHTYRIPAQLVE